MKRWYVTLTWEDWPEGGSWGAIIEAENHEEAEHTARLLMADARRDSWDEKEGVSLEQLVKEYLDQWHLVDCFDLDEFIERNRR